MFVLTWIVVFLGLLVLAMVLEPIFIIVALVIFTNYLTNKIVEPKPETKPPAEIRWACVTPHTTKTVGIVASDSGLVSANHVEQGE